MVTGSLIGKAKVAGTQLGPNVDKRGRLQDLDRRPLHLIVDVDISLCCRQILMTSQFHDDLRADATVGELGDERATTAVAGSAVDPGAAV